MGVWRRQQQQSQQQQHQQQQLAAGGAASAVVTVRPAQTQTERKMSCFTQFLKCLVANQSYRRQRQKEAAKHGHANSTSKIDSLARILFPVSFGLFNFAYWYAYLFSPHTPFTWNDHLLKGD